MIFRGNSVHLQDMRQECTVDLMVMEADPLADLLVTDLEDHFLMEF